MPESIPEVDRSIKMVQDGFDKDQKGQQGKIMNEFEARVLFCDKMESTRSESPLNNWLNRHGHRWACGYIFDVDATARHLGISFVQSNEPCQTKVDHTNMIVAVNNFDDHLWTKHVKCYALGLILYDRLVIKQKRGDMEVVGKSYGHFDVKNKPNNSLMNRNAWAEHFAYYVQVPDGYSYSLFMNPSIVNSITSFFLPFLVKKKPRVNSVAELAEFLDVHHFVASNSTYIMWKGS